MRAVIEGVVMSPEHKAADRNRSGLDTTSTMIFGAIDDSEPDTGWEAEQARLVAGLPPGSALLVVRKGPNAGSRFLLDAPVTSAGRHPDSDIFLDDVTVSRRHAEFLREPESYTVRDVGSLNGTYLNRERVESAALSNGDEVQIGKFRLMFVVAPAASGGVQ
jgi:pSer/pThr/pTyr-binding forkhead associated (FHA) protein